MKKILSIIFIVTFFFLSQSLKAQERIDTVYVSLQKTTHIIFDSDLMYVDVPIIKDISIKIVDAAKNMIAIRAKTPITYEMSLSALESNGKMHNFVVKYVDSIDSPILSQRLLVDMRKSYETRYADRRSSSRPGGSTRITATANESEGKQLSSANAITKEDEKIMSEAESQKKENNGSVKEYYHTNAPQLSEIQACTQDIYHIGGHEYNLTLMVENIYVYSDITYLTLSLENNSGVSYETSNTHFCIESRTTGKHKATFEKAIYPKSSFGTISTPAFSKNKIAYSFDKITLTKDQVLKIYIYEDGGARNFLLVLHYNDINKARSLQKYKISSAKNNLDSKK